MKFNAIGRINGKGAGESPDTRAPIMKPKVLNNNTVGIAMA